MNILTTLSIRNLKLNKKRTISTIIGIILSVALICAVASMGMSFLATLVENAKNQSGYWHLKLENVSDEEIKDIQNNRDVKDTFAIKICGYSILQGSQNDYKPYARLISMNESSFKDLHFELIEGRFPVNNNEVVISKTIMANGKVEYKIGDTINLNVGTRSIKPGVNEKEYDNIYDAEEIINATNYSFKIVGIIERPDTSFEKYSEPGYTVITTGISTGRSDLYISLKSPKNYKETIPQILGIQSYESLSKNDTETKYDYTLNKELLRWEAFAFIEGEPISITVQIGMMGSLASELIQKGIQPKDVNFLTVEGKMDEADFTLIRNYMPNLVSIDLSKSNATIIPDYTFTQKKYLLNISLPHALKSIGQRAFSGCTRLCGTIILPSSVTAIEYGAFMGCTNLRKVLATGNKITTLGDNIFGEEEDKLIYKQ